MAETILTLGKDNSSNIEQTPTVDPGYLVKDKLLSEFKTEAEKSAARQNLGVLPAENVYTKEEIEPVIVDKISRKLAEHLDSSEHITEEEIIELLADLVKIDGTTPFTAPQAGKDPVSNHHLTTKIYVDSLIQNCLKIADKAKILEQVTNTLRDYIKYEDVYTKDQIYTKDEITSQNSNYVKIDGTTPFERPQSGRTPQISSHLTTKGYVDSLLQSHKDDIDPHGFTEKLSNKLRKYALKENVYDRTQTYSRGQIDQIIDKLVSVSVEEALRSHKDLDDPHNIIEKVKQLGYVNKDGSVSFTAPQKGVDAKNPQELVTLRQLQSLEKTLKEDITNLPEPIWITSGPVESQVGMVNEGDVLANEVSFQEAMDAIFYGKRVKLTVPELAPIGEKFLITLCIQGSLATVEYVEIYQNGENIGLITREQLQESNCVTIDSLPIDGDAEIVAKVFYTNGSIHEVTATTKVSLPVFVGIINRRQFTNTVTYQQLLELHRQDPQNNVFYDKGKHMQELTHNFNFDEDLEQKIIIALPNNYSNLDKMYNSAQMVTVDAFDIISMIPFAIPGSSKDVIYKLYSYKQDLYSLNSDITFKFK